MTLYDPARYDETPVRELLGAAATGHIGVDRRLLRSILERSPSAVEDVLAFARESGGQQRVDLDPVLVDLFRHWRTPEALDFYLAAVRRRPEEVSDELAAALLNLGERVLEPLLELYAELDEEEAGDVAFILARLQRRDPRILQILLDRLEFDAADGAFLLGLYGDPAARPHLEALLGEVPEDEVELRREIEFSLGQLGREPETCQPEPFNILHEYAEKATPVFEVLSEAERIELLGAPDAETRAEAAHSFFGQELRPGAREALFRVARSDASPQVRGAAWASLADASGDAAVCNEMLAVLRDPARDANERGGAAVGLYAVADRDEVREAIEKLYQEGGAGRARALEAMWRSLWKPYARFFAAHLEDPDIEIARQALRGAGYFQLTGHLDKIASYFDAEGEKADLREEALFAYALAMPGETTRGRVRGMLRKIGRLAGGLDEAEAETVMFALDERLRLRGLKPVFENEGEPEPLA